MSFFDYFCDECGSQFCERVNLMNLALDQIDEAYCINCLAKDNDLTVEKMADFAWGYIEQRDCFKDPWMKFDASACPLIEDNACHCQLPKEEPKAGIGG